MEEQVRIQDDLYEAVNGEWLKTAEIPGDMPMTGGFANLAKGVEKIMMDDFNDFSLGNKQTDIKEMMDAVKVYKKVIDLDRRNNEGIQPVLPLLDRIKGIKSLEELNAKSFELSLSGMELPFNYGVEPDMKDATKHAFILVGADLILPDTVYYQEGNPVGPQLLGLWQSLASQALAKTNLTSEEQQLFLADTIKFDAIIATKVKSRLEWADYVKNYNPMTLEEAINALKPFDFKGFLGQIYGEYLPKMVIAYDKRAIEEFNGLFNEETFEAYMHWSYVKSLMKAANYLSEELHTLATTYQRTLTGVAQEPVIEKQAYQLVSRLYAEPVGVYYGRTYFGEEAKKDIVELVKKIIEMYKERIRDNKFLAEKTKEKAILKLSTMVIKMGYPDSIDPLYSELKVDEEDSLLVACGKINKALVLDNLHKLHKPVDRSKWVMPGHMVNACFNPSSNDITFPAAILQKPFYSIHQTVSQNLGGIGAVIGHEISHAFDNNGAQFDENGNLFNWWTKEDYDAFQVSTKQMIEQFDGIEFHGGKVNGQLVVSENIADNGGMAVTLAIMHRIPNTSFKEYFENWARIWCMKAKEEYIALLLNNDVHSPTKLRANIPPRNFPEWYETFGVTEKDQMYIAPEKRIIIW